jgi:two-component system, chemotaxis family, chemotaxis protein CheY
MSKRVLVVDDSISMRQVIKASLTEAGYEVTEAGNGIEAIRALTATPVEMVITDLNMPKMDGIQLIEKMRQFDMYKYMPIIMLTTESAPEKKDAGRKAGATGWIVKPFDKEKLVAVVAKFIGKG